jgi:Leucine-rich repeat (LRR) protein
MLRVIRLESKKEQGNLELTGAELTDLTILDNFGDNKFTLKVLNLWENSLTNIDSLAHFTGLQELYLNENRVTSIHGIARLEHLIQLSFQNNELCGDLPVFNFPHLRYLDLSFNKLTHLHSLSKSQLPSLSYLDVRANDLI